MHDPVWWYLARAAGLTAWALASASVLWGLALSTRALGRHATPKWLLDLHQHLGTLTLSFTVVHVLALVADSQVSFGAVEILVPFASAWRPLPVALGVLALWLLLAVQLSSTVLRKRLSNRAWRRVHLAAFGVYVLATGHYVGTGSETDGLMPWLVLGTSCAVLFLTLLRALDPRRKPKPRLGGARPASGRLPAEVS